MKKIFGLLFIVSILWMGCKQATVVNEGETTQQNEAEIQKASAFFDRAFDEAVDRTPQQQSYLGIKKDYHKWNDISEQNQAKELAYAQGNLRYLKDSIDYDILDEETQLSYQLFEKWCKEKIEDYKYRHYTYPVNQMHGLQSGIPAFLINIHKIDSYKDAMDYLERLDGISLIIRQLINNLKTNEAKGVMLPKFVYEMVLRDCKNVVTGYPFEKDTKKSTLYNDFEEKISKVDAINEEQRKTLLLGCEKRLMVKVKAAYDELTRLLKRQQEKATDEDGVWKFPNGKEFYNYRLRKITTTDLTAEQIHEIGLKEVERIHNEMKAIKDTVAYKGTLKEFFEFMRHDKQFFYPNTDNGREAYMAEARKIIGRMEKKLDDLFITKPKAPMIVKAVEKFREKSAGKAFYQQPAPDGSRPGTYYANMYNMADMPKYQMEALAFHEGIPGHHMQIAIAQEIESLPKFRKYDAHYTAYVEGWGLYSEYIPKELGFYEDPYSDFGRLAMELWRACRLVVDTGIHAKKWTRQEGIDYYMGNTPNPKNDCVKMVDRHIVMPGQATAYKIGMLKILELRQKAKDALEDKFDIRDFHEIVLVNGAVPLSVLEGLVDEYIEQKS